MLNKSGYEIYADNVLVLLADIKTLEHAKKAEDGSFMKDKYGDFMTNSGLLIPMSEVETETNCATEGYLVDIGEKAFEGLTKKPELGQLVTFTRYAGRPIFGDDGKVYRRLGWKELNGGSTSRKL